jgi:hypothetical protein
MGVLVEERPTRAPKYRSSATPESPEVVVRVVGDGSGGGGGAGRRRRGSGGLRALGTVVGLGAVAVAVVVLANAIGAFRISLFGTTRIDRSAPVVLKQLRDVSTYTAASGEFESTVDVEHDVNWLPSFLAGDRAIFVGVGSVDATVDFSKLGADAVNVQDGVVNVTLPEPQLAKPVIDPSRSHVANRDRGLVNRIEGMFTDNPTSEQSLYIEAQKRIAKSARASELRARAEKNTETMLRGLLTKLGFETVNVRFGAAPAS